MAVKKEKAGKLTDQDLAVVRGLEKEIDVAIREQYDGYDHKVTLQVKQLPYKRVEKELRRRYKLAGWHIVFHYDDGRGDGDWIELT